LRRFIVWTGLVLLSLPLLAQQDPRLNRLKSFFEAAHSPIRHLAADFLAAADYHNLDWRLLPSISMVESTAGKNCSGNNVFGWKSGRKEFASVREAIYVIASRLAHSRLYRGKNVDGILATYNPRPGYTARVKAMMRRVDPNEPGNPARRPTESAELQLPARPE
jgi:hypothetical protein